MKKDRRRVGHDLKKKSEGPSAKYTVTTLITPSVARRPKAYSARLDDDDDYDSKTEHLLMSSFESDSLPSLD